MGVNRVKQGKKQNKGEDMKKNEALKKLEEITLLKMLHTDLEYREAVKNVLSAKLWSELREEDPGENENYRDAIKELNAVREVREMRIRTEMSKTLRELHLKQDEEEAPTE